MQPLAMPDLVVACWVVAAVLVAWVVVTAVRRYATRATPRDPQRLFDTAQKSEAFSLAGGRCEFETPLLHRRCSRPGRHADHWIPWTLGRRLERPQPGRGVRAAQPRQGRHGAVTRQDGPAGPAAASLLPGRGGDPTGPAVCRVVQRRPGPLTRSATGRAGRFRAGGCARRAPWCLRRRAASSRRSVPRRRGCSAGRPVPQTSWSCLGCVRGSRTHRPI